MNIHVKYELTPTQEACRLLFNDPHFNKTTPIHASDWYWLDDEKITLPELVTRIERERGVKRIYVAGPMRGIPEFNFPAFHAAATQLRSEGWSVFNPAEKDNERHGTDISKGNATGDESIAAKDHGFNLREALALDLEFICKHADAIALLPGWERSQGATAEHATAVALGLEVIHLK